MRRLRYIIGALLAVLWMAPLSAQEPTGTIRGRVIDNETQQPLARVTVAVGSRGALTQADGRFVITGVPVGTGTLRARMLGYAPATRPVTVVGGQTDVVDLALTAQAIQLADIVVTGYGEQRAGDIIGAVSQINTEEFNPGRIVSPAQLIESKIAGVQVEDRNEPGAGRSIRIRGATSINASSEPLYVIDGVPVGTGAGGGLSAGRDPLNFLNPDDIESITVLKDASAASIYGANAANGVVLIQTKSRGGRLGQQITYSTNFSTSTVTRLPSMLSAAQYRTAVQEHAASSVGQLLNSNTDWFNLITRSAYGMEHNLSLSSATERQFYRMSLGYLNQDGIIRGSTTERISLGLAYQQRLFDDRLDVRANVKGSRAGDQFTPGGVLGSAATMGPTQPVYDPTTVTGYYDWTAAPPSADNPVAIMNLASDRGVTWRSLGNLQANYRFPFLEALRANVNIGYDVARADRKTFIPSILHSQLRETHGSLYLANQSQVNTLFESFLNYAAPLNLAPGNVDVTAGYSYAQSHAEYPWFRTTGLGTNLLGDNGVSTGATVQNIENIVETKLISFFGRLNYNLGDRFLAAFSVRRDGSSRFGKDNAWGTFPSVAVAWRLSQEPFMRGIEMLSDLKLRASWARTGNQAFGDYLQYSTYTVGDALTQVQFGNEFVTTIRPSAVDPNIRWETTGSTNVGLDFGFRGQRISGAIDWYDKKTTDMIFTVPVAAGTNFSNYVTTNIGSMRNRGIEFSLGARVLEGGRGALGWTVDFTASHNANELLSIYACGDCAQEIRTGGVSGAVGTTIQVLRPGEPINSFFVYEHKTGADGKPVYSTTMTDMYVDRPTVFDSVVCRGSGAGAAGCVGLYRPDGTINDSDLRPFHSPWPTWTLGHTSRLTYSDFDLSFTLRAQLGAYVYNNVASSNGFYNQLTRGSPYNLHTSVLETDFVTEQYTSDYYVEDASFLRMDNVTLGYSFQYAGRPWHVFAAVQNAFTITGYSGVDPTAGLNGLDNNIYPRSRTFTGGLSVRF
jgi:iron complex outermembrane receptor protein